VRGYPGDIASSHNSYDYDRLPSSLKIWNIRKQSHTRGIPKWITLALVRVLPTSVISCVLSLHVCSCMRFFETSCIPTGVFFSRCLVHPSVFLLLSTFFTRVLSWHIIFAYVQLFCVRIYNIMDVRSITNYKSERRKQINLFYRAIRYSPLRV